MLQPVRVQCSTVRCNWWSQCRNTRKCLMGGNLTLNLSAHPQLAEAARRGRSSANTWTLTSPAGNKAAARGRRTGDPGDRNGHVSESSQAKKASYLLIGKHQSALSCCPLSPQEGISEAEIDRRADEVNSHMLHTKIKTKERSRREPWMFQMVWEKSGLWWAVTISAHRGIWTLIQLRDKKAPLYFPPPKKIHCTKGGIKCHALL